MKIRRPIFFPLEFIIAITNPRHISRERVVPDVDDVLFVAGPRNAPLNRSPADGKVAQAAAYERHHFVASRFGLNKIRLRFVELTEASRKFSKLEIITLFIKRC